VINVPPRGIGDTTVDHLRASASRQGLSLWEALGSNDPELPSNARNKLAPFKLLLDKLREGITGNAADAIERVMELTGYEDRLRLEGEEGEERIDNLYELVGAAKEFDAAWRGETLAGQAAPPPEPESRPEDKPLIPNPLTQTRAQYLKAVRAAPGALGSETEETVEGDRPDPVAALAAADRDEADTPLIGFLEQLALVGDADAGGGGERVSLMTLHAAKGLEFDAVWMTGLEERVFPSSRSLGQTGPMASGEEDPAEIAEERRLCYVGMTRARKRLTLSLARCRSLFGELRFNPPSRFVRELPPDLTEGLAALDRLSPMQERARKDVFYDDFDQRPHYSSEPPRPKARFDRYEPASKPPVKVAAAGVDALSPGRRVKHPSFGVGTVEDEDGAGLNRKLTVLARFVEPA
jgi:DNA helicase-2/ATP-dependent DNA helicase PcrA